MDSNDFLSLLKDHNISFFTGVPDSQLGPFCNSLYNIYGISSKHIVAANEGNAASIAAGYHLATGNVPCVYLQNSGEGNMINPFASLLNELVYAIPCLFIIGWRGEPDVHDEPQHNFQGKITLELLKILGISYFVLDKNSSKTEIGEKLKAFGSLFEEGKCAAIVVKRGAFTENKQPNYSNNNSLFREEIIREITKVSGDDIVISTTGKTSRELFEIRETEKQSHNSDFLNVGSMGHCSSIALGIALNKPETKVWCLDGDGSVLMHMGSMAVIGAQCPKNLIHIVINNISHESVGGMPTVADKIDFVAIAKACGYNNAYSIATRNELNNLIKSVLSMNGLTFIEIKSKIGSRKNLGRPSLSPLENKMNFMNYLKVLN